MARKTIPKKAPQHRASRSRELDVDPSRSPPLQDAVKDASEIKGILVRAPIATWRRLKHICADHDKSLQNLLLEGIEHIIETYGRRYKAPERS
jgi:hypothetical protein